MGLTNKLIFFQHLIMNHSEVILRNIHQYTEEQNFLPQTKKKMLSV